MNPDLVRDIRDALAHLYDHAYLETHPLAEKIAAERAGWTRTRAQETRRILLDAIELLNPGDNVPLRAPERRAYEVLFGLYVEGRDPQEVADTLGIGERQLRRDRAMATEALATIVHDRYVAVAGEQREASVTDRSNDAESLLQESCLLAHHYEMVDLAVFFDKLLPLLSGLAQEHHVELGAEIPPKLPPLPLSYPLLRQIVLSLASQSIHHLPLQRVDFLAQVTPQLVGIGLDLIYRHGKTPALSDVQHKLSEHSAVETMVAALNGTVRWEEPHVANHRLWVLLPRRQKISVLVVDDKHELFELFLRYMAGHPYQLCHASTVDEGLHMARADRPDMILLDLMMPERDGWEFLQALRTDPDLGAIPVIVCSVLQEPELAFSLGAQHYLKKPVAAHELLEVLDQIRQQVWEAGMNPAVPALNRPRP